MARLDSPGRPVQLGSVRQEARLKVAPNNPFYLAHLPGERGWMVGIIDSKPFVLPRLKPMVLAGGVNQVKNGRREGDPPDTVGLERRIKRLGGVLLDDPGLFSEYAREHACEHPKNRTQGSFFCTAWDQPKMISGQFRMDHDDEGHHRWLLSLIERGYIAAPEPEVLEDLRHSRDHRVSRMAALAHVPAMKTKLDAEQLLVEQAATATVPAREERPARGRSKKADKPAEGQE